MWVSRIIMITNLIDLYVKYRSIKMVRILFDKMCYEQTTHRLKWLQGMKGMVIEKEDIKLFEQTKYVGINWDECNGCKVWKEAIKLFEET